MKKVGLIAFFLIWARVMGWRVPDFHIRVLLWLETCLDPVRVLKVFRGAGKSTLYAIYKAWQLYCEPTNRSLIWSEDTKLAKKLTRDVIQILRRHPLCRGMLPQAAVGAEEFWVAGAIDARNASMAAHGVLTNATGSRANAVDYDDIEVPKNIKSQEAREKLRERTSEATHILIPGGQETYIGTPHTHDSIYDEQVASGAALLEIPLFAQHVRFEGGETQHATRYPVPFAPEYAFVGIHRFAKLLREGKDYRVEGGELVILRPPADVLDVYAGCAWPQRFDRAELEKRRRRTRTLNAWDSQYALKAKPLHMIRLDPDELQPYEVTPTVEHANGAVRMMLGKVQIVSAAARWDCALGRPTGDVSAFCVALQDTAGRYYWQVARALTGTPFDQCKQIKEHVIALQLPRVTVETNGPGAFAPALLMKELKGTGCAVVDEFSTENKNKRILEAFEAPLRGGFLWAHVDVIETVNDEMKDWKPTVKEQPDNYLDAMAGAIKEQPMRIGRVIGNVTELAASRQGGAWRTDGGTFDLNVDMH